MKDPYALLLQKENELQRLRREIEALRAVLPLLNEEASDSAPTQVGNNKWPLEVTQRR